MIPDDALVVSQIEIIRYIDPDSGGDVVVFRAEDNDGQKLPLVETLGLLRLCEDSAIRSRMEPDEDEDDEDA